MTRSSGKNNPAREKTRVTRTAMRRTVTAIRNAVPCPINVPTGPFLLLQQPLQYPQWSQGSCPAGLEIFSRSPRGISPVLTKPPVTRPPAPRQHQCNVIANHDDITGFEFHVYQCLIKYGL
jgi:hypothetical protein